MKGDRSAHSDETVFGFHAIESLLTRTPERVLMLFLQQERDDKRMQALQAMAAHHTIAMQRLPRDKLDTMAGGVSHQGVIARIRSSAPASEADLEDIVERSACPLLLVLDGVQDPHNLGACLRSAVAAGADAVLVPRDKASGLTPAARKAASGAAELITFVQVTNLARALKQLQKAGVWLVGLAGEASQPLYRADLARPTALLLGAEGSGLRRLTRECCDELVQIPMSGAIESLNVSVAAGICLFEARRQRAG